MGISEYQKSCVLLVYFSSRLNFCL